MTSWKNMGDISPEQGTWLLRNPGIAGEDFTAEVINIIPEMDVGGSDRVFDIGQGNLYLGRKNWVSALRTVGNELRGDIIVAPDHHGGEVEIHPDSEDYLAELAHAAMAYSGPEYELSVLVGIGIPTRHDRDAKFTGEVVLYPGGSSLWSIVKDTVDGLEEIELGVDRLRPEGITALDDPDGPYAGMPRDIRKMSDLIRIKAFSDLGVDCAGNPKVWRHEYRLPDDPDYPEVVVSAHEEDTFMFEGVEYTPNNTTWIGPEQKDLIEAWESLYAGVRQPEERFEL